MIYKRGKNGGKKIATDHALYNLLKYKPWSEGNSFEWREMLVGHLELRGNAYAFIEMTEAGVVTALIPLNPDRVRAARSVVDNSLYYEVSAWNGGWFPVPREWIFHIKNRSEDGVYGLSVLELARRDLDRALQIQKYSTNIYANGAKLGGVLEHPGQLSKDATEKLRASFRELYSGSANAGSTAVLEEGMKFNPISITPTDAKFLEASDAGVEDISRWTNVSKHMLGIHSDASFSNMEQQALEFVQYTVFPECARWEAAYNEQLLSERERNAGYFIEYNIAGLLRGDTATRFASYAIGRQWGFYSANDIRSLENFDPIENGDIYLQPFNMVEAGTVPTTPPSGSGGLGDTPGGAPVNPDAGKRTARALIDFDQRHMGEVLLDRQKRSFQRLFEERAVKLMTKESKFLESVAKKCAKERDLGDLAKQVEKFYEEHRSFVASEIRPTTIGFSEQVADLNSELTTAREAVIDKRVASWSDEYCARHKNEVSELIKNVEPINLLEALEERTRTWREKQFGKVAESLISTILTTNTEIAA
jgi:HK97 family phage portal protein